MRCQKPRNPDRQVLQMNEIWKSHELMQLSVHYVVDVGGLLFKLVGEEEAEFFALSYFKIMSSISTGGFR